MNGYTKLAAVLRSFSVESPSHTLSEIARETGIPISTAHRLLNSLVVLDLLAKTEDKRYVIGQRIWELGVLSPKTSLQRTHVVPHLERLFLATRCQVAFSALGPDGSLTIEQMVGWGSQLSGGLGDALPLHASSPGLVALAFGPRSTWSGLRRHPLMRFTETTLTHHEQLRRAVQRVYRDGFAVSRGSLVTDTASLSVPVFGYRGSFYGALSILWKAQDAEPPARPQLLRSAQTISIALHDVPSRAFSAPSVSRAERC